MAFDKSLLDIIACPVSKSKLILVNDNGVEKLVSKFSRLVYDIKDGIPVLLEDEATKLTLEEMEQLLKK